MASAFIVIPHPERERFGQSWDIIHAQSGATIQPYTGPLSRKLKKAEAEHIAKYASQVADTDDPKEAAAKLRDAGYLDLIRTFCDPRYARIPMSRQFPLKRRK